MTSPALIRGLLTPAEAAEWLGISPATLKALVDRGEIPYILPCAGRIRPRRKFRLEDLHEYAERSRRWRSTAAPDRPTGISKSQSRANAIAEALARRTGEPPKLSLVKNGKN